MHEGSASSRLKVTHFFVSFAARVEAKMEDATAARDKDCHDDLDPVQHDFISTGKSSSKQPYIFFFCSIPKHQEEIMARADLLVLLHALTSQLYTLL